MSTNLYTKDSFSEVSLELDPLEQTSQRLPESEQQTAVVATEIWVGYIKHGRNFIDKLPKADNIELQLYAFDEYYKRSFSPVKRFISKWVLCKKPVIFAAQLSAVCSRLTIWLQQTNNHIRRLMQGPSSTSTSRMKCISSPLKSSLVFLSASRNSRRRKTI
jgi:hypothetical protein